MVSFLSRTTWSVRLSLPGLLHLVSEALQPEPDAYRAVVRYDTTNFTLQKISALRTSSVIFLYSSCQYGFSFQGNWSDSYSCFEIRLLYNATMHYRENMVFKVLGLRTYNTTYQGYFDYTLSTSAWIRISHPPHRQPFSAMVIA